MSPVMLTITSFLQLSIQHFDRSSLRRVQTRDHSQPMVKEEMGYEGDISSGDEEA